MSLGAAILGVGLVAPGMADWTQAVPVLRGERPWQAEPLVVPKPALLPANERRRTTTLIRLAIGVAEQAQLQSGYGADELACVFASAEGDTDIVDRLCEALSQPQKPVSPTQFHNSVHNAPAGYWAIAARAQGFSTSITAGPNTFAAGLLEALSWLHSEQQPVLLLAYDVALPPLLSPHGDVQLPFACALVLAPPGSAGAIARLHLDEAAAIGDAGLSAGLATELAALAMANPAAAALPLLRHLACATPGANPGALQLPGMAQTLVVQPC